MSVATGPDHDTRGEEGPDIEECLDARGGRGDCAGATEYRESLSGTGRSFARCDYHWDKRLDEQERIRRNYPDTPTPPAWFDPTYAGERWDEDD